MEQLNNFLHQYERAANSHDFAQVEPLIAEDAVYWFSDGSFEGLKAIAKAFEATWAKIQNEAYAITNVRWIGVAADSTVCTYNFHWTGIVDGKERHGAGRGTNVVVKSGGRWKMLHEHLSKMQ
ncbi:MAG TPA: nuclear transport factor 2 family protein [Candidatus Saccharimonadales bacterium]|jgi:ketosteroid isomerase-like protein